MHDLKIKIETFQNMLIDIATGGTGSDIEYKELRNYILSSKQINELLPKFILTNRSISQFWQFIKYEYSTYADRRKFIHNELSRVLDYLETTELSLINKSTVKSIEKFNQNYILTQWSKALERKKTDPEGAITSARTLIETTCKYILDRANVDYNDTLDLPKLYKKTALELNLAPDQHTEDIFKQILGGCQTIVIGLGALRNKLSDSHGRRTTQIKPSSRHAELAVNLAGIMTTFLLETFELKHKK